MGRGDHSSPELLSVGENLAVEDEP